MNEKECCEMVNDSSGWHKFHCARPVKVIRDGKPYCAIHDPEAVQKRREKSDAKYELTACKSCGIHVFNGSWARTFSYCPHCGTKRIIS
jgi:predicted RNA-binding Zn-ribbon protein involved in translation (DUF1610 family)